MSRVNLDRLVRSAVALREFCIRQRAPKGGAPLVRKAERLLGEALGAINADGFASQESNEKLLTSVAVFSEYLDLIR